MVDKLTNTKDNQHWADGDLLRLVVLLKYGGVYVDADTILLRHLSPLLGGEWLYQWSAGCNDITGAVARFHRNCSVVRHLLGQLAKTGPGLTNWGAGVYQWAERMFRERYETAFTVLPSCIFDPPCLGSSRSRLMKSVEWWSRRRGIGLSCRTFMVTCRGQRSQPMRQVAATELERRIEHTMAE